MKKRLLSTFTALLMVCSLVMYLPANFSLILTAEAVSETDVTSWMESKNGTSITENGYTQCVAAFYSYLRLFGITNPYDSYPVGGARQIFDYDAPAGWEKISGSGNYRVGDVVIWNGNVGGGWGHVGMVYSTSGTIQIFDQNWVTKNQCGIHNISSEGSISGVFRPPLGYVPRIDTPVDNSYQVPCELTATKKYDVYDVYGNPEYNSNGVKRYIAQNDECTIHEVYGSGYVKVTYPVGSGTHTAYALNDGWELEPIYVNHSPIGDVNSISGGEGYIHITGWAFDEDNASKSLEIHVYIGGPYHGHPDLVHAIGGIMADKPSVDVTNCYGVGGNHRFDVCIETSARGEQPVYVYAINNEGGNNPCIGSGTANISEKKGHVMTESEAAGQTIPDGKYIIISELGRRVYLDIPGVDYPAKSGTKLIATEGSTLPTDKYDTWTIKYLNNGFYTIKQNGQPIGLDVPNASLDHKTKVQTYTYNETIAQQWSIRETQDHGYSIQARANAYYLDVANAVIGDNGNIITHEGNGSKAQSWCFIPVASDDKPIEDGEYHIKSACGDVYLDAYGHTNTGDYKNGTNIDVALSNNDSFIITYVGDGYYKIIEKSSGLSLDVEDGDTSAFLNRKNVQLWEYNTNNKRGQLWKIVDEGNGYYRFVSKLSGYSLDLAGMKTDNGSNVQVHPYNTSNAQKWSFEKIHHHNYTSEITKDAKCTEEGIKTYTCECGDTYTEPIPATGHKWNAATYTWSTDNKICTAIRVCANDSTHKESETVNSTYSVTTEPTFNDKGTGTYTATFKNSAFAKQTHNVIIPRIETPENPTVSYEKGDGLVELTWTDVLGAEGYAVYGYVNSNWKQLAEETGTYYILKNLKAGTNYKVAVIAKFNGNWNKDFSNAIIVTPRLETPQYPVVTSEVSGRQFRLKWTSVPNATKYGLAVYQSGKWRVKVQFKANVTSYTSPKMKTGSYKMVVCAKVNGEWDTSSLSKRAFTVKIA